jgi:hypothetical protein
MSREMHTETAHGLTQTCFCFRFRLLPLPLPFENTEWCGLRLRFISCNNQSTHQNAVCCLQDEKAQPRNKNNKMKSPVVVKKIKIYIVHLTGKKFKGIHEQGQHLLIDVSPRNTIQSLKQTVAARLRAYIPANEQEFVFAGRILQDAATIEESGLMDYSTIALRQVLAVKARRTKTSPRKKTKTSPRKRTSSKSRKPSC